MRNSAICQLLSSICMVTGTIACGVVLLCFSGEASANEPLTDTCCTCG